MLGSDPVSALLGVGLDPCSPAVVWKKYLRGLVETGAAVTMLGPDVVVPEGADDLTRRALHALIERYPSGSRMPVESTGKLAGMQIVDAEASRVNLRVAAYFRRIASVAGKERAPELLQSGAITASAALHVQCSNMVAVEVPDAVSLKQWRGWAAACSGDVHEAHTAPTLLIPGYPGGGVYLFRVVGEPVGARTMQVGASVIDSGDVAIPIPPTRQNGMPVMRLGPCRILPDWLRAQILADGKAVRYLAPVS